MKYLLLCLSILFFTETFGHSEQLLTEVKDDFGFSYKLDFGEMEKIGKGKCIGVFNGELIATIDEKENFQIINNELNVKQEKLFLESTIYKELQKHAGYLSYFKIKIFESKIGLFYSYKQKSNNTNTLNFLLFNIEDNSFTKPIKLMTTTGKNRFKEEEYSRNPLFKMIFSPDQSKMAIISTFDREDFEPILVEIVIFNEDMDQESHYKLPLPVKGEGITLLNSIVLENGDVYIETSEVIKANKKKHTNKKVFKRIYWFKNSEEKIISYDLKLEEKYIASSHIYINEEGIPQCIGYYSKGKNNWGVFQIDLSQIENAAKIGSYSKSKTKAWFTPDGYLDSDTGPSVLYNPSPQSHKVRHVIPDGNNGLYLCTEFYHEGWSLINDNYMFKANDIYISRIDQNGEILWTSIVDKEQLSGSDNGEKLSFSFHIKNGTAYFMFNAISQLYDENNRPKNRDKYIEEIRLYKAGAFKLNSLVLAKVDLSNGNVSKYVLHNNKTNKLYFIPRSSYYDEESNTLHFFSGKRFSSPLGAFGKIQF